MIEQHLKPKQNSMHSFDLETQSGTIHLLQVDALEVPPAKLLPIVLIHGMACSASIWETQLSYIAQTRPAIAMDLRGHGTSTPPANRDYSPAACAGDLFDVLNTLQLEKIVLVGHSYGAWVALAAATARPETIAQLVLVDPAIDCTQLSPEAYAEQIAPMQAALETEAWRSVLENSFNGALTGGTEATKAEILARLAASPKDCLLGTARELFTFEAVKALDQYMAASGAPVSLILAESNNLPLSLHVLRPTLPTITIPNTSHWLMLDAPEAFAKALDDCLAIA